LQFPFLVFYCPSLLKRTRDGLKARRQARVRTAPLADPVDLARVSISDADIVLLLNAGEQGRSGTRPMAAKQGSVG
jgi:hypothetical protein